jgi:protein-tyrosine-phosphatase/GNAT superfamily N-acetyltransferase
MAHTGNPIIERGRGNAVVSTDPARLDMDVIYGFLSSAYWCEGIPRETLERAIRNSICFGVYVDSAQVGFARVITDRATFGYLGDVFILESHRGRGLSKLLMETVMSHPDLQGLRRFSLATRDAHGLYAQFGFKPPRMPQRLMEILDPGVYPRPRTESAPAAGLAQPVAGTPDRQESAAQATATLASPLSDSVKHILFVCIGNTCRSPMAEAFANHLGEGRVCAWSAGLFAVGWIAPETYAVMAEKGLSLEGQWSKDLEEMPVAAMDVVVDMTGDESACPVPDGFKGRVVKWRIPDAFTRDLECNRTTRDLIEAHVRALLAEIQGDHSRSNPGPGNSV